MMSRRTLGWAIAGWALATWGGRIGLLADTTDVWSWVRIASSLAVAAAAAVVLLRRERPSRAVLGAYAIVTAAVWLTSLVSVWTAEHDLAFRLVHTVLAVPSLGLAGAAGTLAVRPAARTRPGRAGFPGRPGSPPR